jgi:hypothetical protein
LVGLRHEKCIDLVLIHVRRGQSVEQLVEGVVDLEEFDGVGEVADGRDGESGWLLVVLGFKFGLGAVE